MPIIIEHGSSFLPGQARRQLRARQYRAEHSPTKSNWDNDSDDETSNDFNQNQISRDIVQESAIQDDTIDDLSLAIDNMPGLGREVNQKNRQQAFKYQGNSLVMSHYLTSPEEMADVMHLRMYVSKTPVVIPEEDGYRNHPITPAIANELGLRLVGGVFADGGNGSRSMDTQLSHTIAPASSSLNKIANSKQQSLIQRLKAIKYQYNTNIHSDKSKGFIDFANQGNHTLCEVRAGREIQVDDTPPTLDEVLKWAIKNALHGDDESIINDILNLEQDIHAYISQNNHQGNASKAMEKAQTNISKRNTKIQKRMKNLRVGEYENKAQSLSQQLDNLAATNRDNFLSNILVNAEKPATTGKKTKLSTVVKLMRAMSPKPTDPSDDANKKDNHLLDRKNDQHVTSPFKGLDTEDRDIPVQLPYIHVDDKQKMNTGHRVAFKSIAEDTQSPQTSGLDALEPINGVKDSKSSDRPKEDGYDKTKAAESIQSISSAKPINARPSSCRPITKAFAESIDVKHSQDKIDNLLKSSESSQMKHQRPLSGVVRSKPADQSMKRPATAHHSKLESKHNSLNNAAINEKGDIIEDITRSKVSKSNSLKSSNNPSKLISQMDRNKSNATKYSVLSKAADFMNEVNAGTVDISKIDASFTDGNFVKTVHDNFQHSMRGPLAEAARLSHEIHDLQHQGDNLLHRSNVLGNRMLNQLEAFHHRQFYHRHHVSKLIADKEFNYDRNYSMKRHYLFKTIDELSSPSEKACSPQKTLPSSGTMSKEIFITSEQNGNCKQASDSRRPTYTGDGLDVMRYLESYTAKTIKNTRFKALSHVSWFISALTKLVDYHHRISSNIPVSLFRFMSVLSNMFMFGYSDDMPSKRIFYQILENTMPNLEDLSNTRCHKILTLIRDVVHIGHNEFLKYLEDRNVTPCPELVIQCRFEKRDLIKRSHNKNRKHNKNNSRVQSNNRPLSSIDEAIPFLDVSITSSSGLNQYLNSPGNMESLMSPSLDHTISQSSRADDKSDDYEGMSQSDSDWEM